MRMLGAVFAEMDEDWASRRWFTEDPIAKTSDGRGPRAPEPACGGTAAERAARIISPVVGDSGIPARRAA